eukprot:g3766.t1
MSKRKTKSKNGQGEPYFVDNKKGEVNELRQLLKNAKLMRIKKNKRDVIKKVIAYMTLGIDVSGLFTEMIMAASTKDVVVKKMVYQYLTTYAVERPDLAILCINTLRKDCKDDDPVIRGLALRSLVGMRLESIVEYLYEPLMSSLKDPSPYVRKTAVMGCLKLYHISPGSLEDSIVDTLYQMLRDRDTVVVANAIVALTEIMHEEGGIAINQQIIHHLLNRVKNFNEWGQCIVLNLVANYTPSSEEEVFSIMNLLDGCLQIANSAVVIAAAKCFLHFSSKMGESFQRQVYSRLKKPLITLTAVPSFEVDYCVYKHIALLASRQACKGVFDSDYKSFFCRYNDPTCVQLIKLEILSNITNENNANEVIDELSEYVNGVDASVSRRSIKAIGEIGIQIQSTIPKVVKQLQEFLDFENFVRAETVVVLKDILRKYPQLASKVIPSIHKTLTQIDEAEGKAAVIWMIGEYGEQLDEGPYILETLVETLKKNGTKTEKLELMTAAMKLFFKRPPEAQKLLGSILNAILDPEANVDADLHDRALFFYRLLREDIESAEKIVNASKGGAVRAFAEEANNEIRERVFQELNTLSVLYNSPAESFTRQKYLLRVVQAESNNDQDEDDQDENDVENLVQDDDVPVIQNDQQKNDDVDDLGGLLGDFLDDDDVENSTAPSKLELQSKHSVSSKTFQSCWLRTKSIEVFQASLSKSFTSAQLEAQLKDANVFCMASGPMGKNKSVTKFFMYATDLEDRFYMTQILYEAKTRRFKATCKTENGDMTKFIDVIKSALGV